MNLDTTNHTARVRARRTLCTLSATAAMLSAGCRVGIFDNDDPKWRVPDSELRRIDAIDPVAISETAPVTLEEATNKRLADVVPPPMPAEAAEISLAEVRAAVLANNLDLRTSLLAPAIARQNLSAEEAKFDNIFFANYNRDTNSVFSDLAQGRAADSESWDVGLRVPLATGGNISVSSPVTRSASGLSFGGEDEDWLAAMRFSMSQPLLRGAGIDANTHSIRVAAWQGQITDSRTKLEAIRILSNADKAYWNFYAAYRELGVRRAQYDVALEQLERARRRVQAGDAPEIEVVRAESGIGRTLEQIIVADANVRVRQRALKRLMNRSDLPVSQDTPLKPTTEANPVGLKLDGGELADRAIANRMELLELELQLAIDQSEIGFRRNAALPLFLLDYGYDIQGTGTEVHNAYRDLGDSDSFNIGLRAEIPMSNDVAESRLNAAILTRVQRLATREARRLAIRTEVFDALDATTQTWQRILAARLEALLAARTLLAEQRQFDVGLRTSVEVLDASARLADAQSREVIALAAYQNALVDIAFATGTSLGSARIRWEPFGFDELPELERLPEAREPATRGGFTVEQPAASSAPAGDAPPSGAAEASPSATAGGAAKSEAPPSPSAPGDG